jgi:hypothetical protein
MPTRQRLAAQRARNVERARRTIAEPPSTFEDERAEWLYRVGWLAPDDVEPRWRWRYYAGRAAHFHARRRAAVMRARHPEHPHKVQRIEVRGDWHDVPG